jgi:hypothetical protein
VQFDLWFRRPSTHQLPIGLLWFITGIRVADTCIVEDHFAKFHVLEAELHLLSEKKNYILFPRNRHEVFASDMKYDEVLKICRAEASSDPSPGIFVKYLHVAVFVTRCSYVSFSSGQISPDRWDFPAQA